MDAADVCVVSSCDGRGDRLSGGQAPVGWLGVGIPWLAGCPSCSRVAVWTCSSTWPISA
jgi:hypothetical protein